ncbi:MAG: hypothetical protein ABR535_05590 [Pyrinomonadaceae bacterium]
MYKGVLLRVVPFILAFAAGLFIASFFVAIAFPNFNWQSGRRWDRRGELHRLRIENHELKRTNQGLRQQVDELRLSTPDVDALGEVAPPTNFEIPPPPPAPRAPRYVK